MGRQALFLDRDGVINVDHGYVSEPSQFSWIEGVFETVRVASRLGLVTIVVTNQAGIARGYYTEAAFQALTRWMQNRFAAEGAPVSAVYHCPFHPEGRGEYRVTDHPDRKPKPGMLLRAAVDHHIDMERSALIGDQESDIEAGFRAGVAALARFNPRGSEVSTRASTLLHSHSEAQEWLLRQFSDGASETRKASTPP